MNVYKKEDRNVDGVKPLVVAAVVIHDPQHAALAVNEADPRHDRSQWTDLMR
jgi:hypothetical protein